MFTNIPPVTQRLIIANGIVFLLTLALGNAVLVPFALWPIGAQFAPWQLFTYAFLHGSVMHLVFNMFGLGMFGSDLERVWGSRRYLIYYGVSVLAAALVQLALGLVSGASYPTIGASGGVFGLLLAFAMYFPRRTVMLIFPPIPMPAWVFATLYGALELFLGVTGTAAGVAHFAHLGGMLGGYLLIRVWRTRRGPFAGR
jgi:membrane associated rhomboid family serine protease